jgi:hypothetical protein
MGILSPAAANAAKRAIETALPDRCVVVRVDGAVDPSTGAWTGTVTPYASGIPCRVDKSGLTPREQAIADRRASAQAVRVTLSVHPSRWPGGIPTTSASDRLVVTGDGVGTYEAGEDGGPVTDELSREIVAWRIS